MRYAWRIALTSIIIIANLVTNFSDSVFSISYLITILLNGAIGWIIGYQIDKYRLSKKELGSTKSTLLDYSYALDSVGEAIGITDEARKYIFVNETAAKLYGFTKDEFISLNWENLFSRETIENINKVATLELMKNGCWRGEGIGMRKDGTTFPQEITLSLMKESKNTIIVIRDITKQKKYEKIMKYSAEHNDLTDLPNRRRLLADLAILEEKSVETSLLFIDLDRFKLVNDNLGHEIGDQLLINIARKLNSFKNELVTVYHHGGDEFIAIIRKSNQTSVTNLASEILNKIKQPVNIQGNEVFITSSIGISHYPEHTNTINDLIKTADTAMYYAKLEGKDTFKIFNKELELQLERKSLIESELRKAIKNEQLFILFQPKLNLKNLELVGVEALVRWNHPQLGLVSPGEFIPVAEETGLIIDIGKWVINESLHQIRKWANKGHSFLKISVNVSQRQFRDKELVQSIASGIHTHNIDTKYFEVEITESVIEDIELAIPILNSIKEMGVGISIDDFGTGYSSLNILKDLPIDTLKIDQSFVHELLINPKNYSLVKTILEIGNILGLKVVAEGIETEAQLKSLLHLKCSIGQGYYFSKPISAEEFEDKLLKQTLHA